MQKQIMTPRTSAMTKYSKIRSRVIEPSGFQNSNMSNTSTMVIATPATMGM